MQSVRPSLGVSKASTYHNHTFNNVEILLKVPELVDALDNAQMSPLHYTIKRKACGPIRRLLDAGADPLIPYPDPMASILHILLPHTAEGGQIYMGREAYVTLVQL